MNQYTQNGDAIFCNDELLYDGVDRVNGQRIIALLEVIDALKLHAAQPIPRTTVAAALAELHDLILDRHDFDFRGDTKNDLLDAVDATIAKLGLEER